MKIAHVITRMILGGAQENTLATVRGLRALGKYDVTLITGPELGPEGDLLSMKPVEGLRVLNVPSLRRNVHPFHDLAAVIALYRIFRKEKFDVVHTHSSKAGILGRLAAHWAGTRLVVHSVHGFAVGPYQSRIRNAMFSALECWAARWTDVLICVSDSLVGEAVRLGLKPRIKTMVVTSAFDWHRFEQARERRQTVRQELGFDSDDIVIAKVARFFPLKGHDQLFEVVGELLDKYPRCKFLLVGDGPLRRQFEELAQQWGWAGRVLFTGLVKPSRVADLLGASDFLVHTSLREGLARVIAQAFACSLSVVSYDIDGAPDLVKDGQTGFLVRTHDREGLLRAMSCLVEKPGERQRMGENGHRSAGQRFSLDRMIGQLDAIYQGGGS